MSEPRLCLLRTATTTAEAKVLVAILQGEGIRAYVDGESLADELAISRRAMNLNGVHVRVAAADLERAREFLAADRVDDAELEAQALAATAEEAPPQPTAGGARPLPWLIAIASSIAAILFFSLWQDAASILRAWRRNVVIEPTAGGWRELDPDTRRPLNSYTDADGDGLPEIAIGYAADGTVLTTSRDADEDGMAEETEEILPHGWRLRWLTSNDRQLHRCEIRDADGKLVRTQRFDGANGFVDEH